MRTGFFDLECRHERLEALGDSLPKLNEIVDWEGFRSIFERIRQKDRKGNAARKPYDVILIFKVLVLPHLNNLADEQSEYQIRSCYSFCRFLGLSPEGKVPDARTIWQFLELLKEHGLVDELFVQLNGQISAAGYIPRQGQIVDESTLWAPRQRKCREGNPKVKRGGVLKGWEENPNMRRQKDLDARWTKKYGRTHNGCKNHISIDRKHKKLNRQFEIAAASVADAQVVDVLLDSNSRSGDVWGDTAYRSRARAQALKEAGAAAISTAVAKRLNRYRPANNAPTANVLRSARASSMCLRRIRRWVARW